MQVVELLLAFIAAMSFMIAVGVGTIAAHLRRITEAIEEDGGLPVPEAVAETKQKPTGPAPRVGFGRREQ